MRPAATTRKNSPMPDEVNDAIRSTDAMYGFRDPGRSMKKRAHRPNATVPTKQV